MPNCVFSRGMLSAAHVLAMDAKNLLDVVDSIRIKYPHVNKRLCSQGAVSETETAADGPPTEETETASMSPKHSSPKQTSPSHKGSVGSIGSGTSDS